MTTTINIEFQTNPNQIKSEQQVQIKKPEVPPLKRYTREHLLSLSGNGIGERRETHTPEVKNREHIRRLTEVIPARYNTYFRDLQRSDKDTDYIPGDEPTEIDDEEGYSCSMTEDEEIYRKTQKRSLDTHVVTIEPKPKVEYIVTQKNKTTLHISSTPFSFKEQASLAKARITGNGIGRAALLDDSVTNYVNRLAKSTNFMGVPEEVVINWKGKPLVKADLRRPTPEHYATQKTYIENSGTSMPVAKNSFPILMGDDKTVKLGWVLKSEHPFMVEQQFVNYINVPIFNPVLNKTFNVYIGCYNDFPETYDTNMNGLVAALVSAPPFYIDSNFFLTLYSEVPFTNYSNLGAVTMSACGWSLNYPITGAILDKSYMPDKVNAKARGLIQVGLGLFVICEQQDIENDTQAQTSLSYSKCGRFLSYANGNPDKKFAINPVYVEGITTLILSVTVKLPNNVLTPVVQETFKTESGFIGVKSITQAAPKTKSTNVEDVEVVELKYENFDFKKLPGDQPGIVKAHFEKLKTPNLPPTQIYSLRRKINNMVENYYETQKAIEQKLAKPKGPEPTPSGKTKSQRKRERKKIQKGTKGEPLGKTKVSQLPKLTAEQNKDEVLVQPGEEVFDMTDLDF